ncbi:hypothetical protein C8R46DRAFT_1137092 [Mycena filopes]|nr:hypothetical protein C8R46DRAFT_1137092 [Mycena filopes]
MNLEALRSLSASTTLSLSKFRVHFAVSDFSLTLRSPALHSVASRSPTLVHLGLRDVQNIKDGAGSLFLPGLEKIDLRVCTEPTYPMSWLPDFAARHASLQVVKFSGVESTWRRNPDIRFPLQFLDTVDRKSLTRTAGLDAFSLTRPSFASSSLDDWEATELELTMVKGTGIFTLRIASSLAANTSVLVLRMSRFAKQPVHIDDVVSSLSLFPSLKRLELHCLNRHLLYEGCPPWVLPSPDLSRFGKTSRCIGAHAALLWIAAQVSQATALDLLHITDEGSDFDDSGHKKRPSYPWTLNATYRIQRNGDLEFHGTADFNVAPRYQRVAVATGRPIIYGVFSSSSETCP